ncbi:hypothetical protein HMPREF9318_01084 [Streptococcus urinalis FB127-CNA-2]|uniref:Beta-eliminating lyase n=1 Tax=Streptococcus urinalis 2285-97 TaxID=764291 RepID=G5KHM7_9STRE|nr:beta-eliminating lyase [Streptococcus urinalis 2285-97]EKS21130.1 hypothetical protein HMPREF9318_01084 [Streptococcus urinalis FB127-CNA-2]VEF31139.1 threonine aldolase [Streptococcus urinalis]
MEFVTGGTQTNQLVIDSLLKSYEGVVSAETGHVATHEAGAIEFSGHKVITLPQEEGKINSHDLQSLLIDFYNDGNHEHMVFPGMVYISHPTEYGSLYTKKELEDLAGVCREYNIPLYLDSARLGYALGVEESDVTLEVIAELCDVFYIGGTKIGALAGEAIVYTKENKPAHFAAIMKQHGALAAKSRLFSVQFDRFFTDDLYVTVGKQTIEHAKRLKAILKAKNYSFFYESPTNQQFIIVKNTELDHLKSFLAYSFWEKYDDQHTVIRLAVSWSTTDEDLDQLEQLL